MRTDILINQSIVWPEADATPTTTAQFAMTPTALPTPVPDPREISLSGGLLLTEELSYTDQYDEAHELSTNYCGPESETLDSKFTMIKEDNGGRAMIYRGDELVYEFASWDFMGYEPWNFCAWGENWMVEGNEVVVLNGEILNYKFDVDEVFDWHLLGGKPLFFARKNQHYYIYYDDVLLPVEYDSVTHYLCCAQRYFNPRTTGEFTWFNASRDGVSYRVMISIDSE